MPVETVTPTSLEWVYFVFKTAILLISLLYLVFSLIVVRQVNLMTETIITEVTPFLRFLSVLHAGLSLGVIILVFGLLFF
jgi:hypothetical protein